MPTEAEILYTALLRLTTSPKPLKAISDYAISLGAVRGLLLETYPQLRVVDEWAAPGLRALGPAGSTFVEQLDETAAEPLFIGTVTPPNGLEMAYSALAVLPLSTNNRAIGWLVYVWHQPHNFDEAECHLLTALAHQSAPVFNLIWSLSSGQRKVIELQMAKRESEILRSAANQLSQATDAVALLEAVSAYPRMTGASSGRLAYYRGAALHTVAVWQKGSSTREVSGEQLDLEAAAFGGDEVVLLDARHYTGGSRAVLNLNGRGASLGALVFDWEETNYFNDRDRYLYQALAQQIAAVIDSIQLFEQINLRAERAERRLRVNGALSQATDELQILAALAQYPQLHTSDWLTLAYLDTVNAALLVEPIAYYAKGALHYWEEAVTQVVDGCSMDDLWVQTPDQVAFIENIGSDIRLPPAERAHHLKEKKTRALALVPLFSNGRYQGILYVAWFQPHEFSEDEKYVLEEIRQSLPAFIASRRAYLAQEKTRQETEQRAHELATIAQISALISSILDEDLLLEKVAEVTRASFPHYLVLIYLLVDGWLVRIAHQQHVYPDDDPITYRLPMFLETSLMVRAAQTRQILVVDDIPNNTQYRLLPLMAGARSEMVVPILAGDEVIGVVDVQSRAVGHFADPDARVIQTLVDMIAVAIQNARLYRQARQLAVSEERNRLARELHDSVSQALYGIVLGANTAQTLLKEKRYDQLEGAVSYVLSLAKAGLDEIRASIFDLRPVVLQDQGLIQAITSQVNALQIRHGIQIKMELCSEPDLPFQIKEEIYRIVREALHNIVKHAQATQVSVTLQNGETAMELLIVDNGVGFDPARPYASLGLKSMRERAISLKGALTIDSTPGSGTRITASLPV